MAGVLQHLRSSTLNKRPNPASMVDGQIAINYASGSPGAFFKDTNGNLVKVGPVHVGATAPNVSPASGGTAGNSVGEQWLDTSGGTYVFKIWDGAAWRSEAGEFVNSTGDTMTGSLTMGPSADIIFEGSVDDGFETTLTVVNPTADRTITLPNVTGTVVTTGDSETVTSTMIRNDTIVNADINASAAIAGTKISPDFGSQNVTTTGTSTAASFIPTSSTVPTNGVYLPAANSVALSTNGTGRLFVDASGNVILGTTSILSGATGRTLQIGTTTDSASTLQFAATTTGNSYIQFGDGESPESYAGYLQYAHTDNALLFGTNKQERLRITSAGLVGIGTSAPSQQLSIGGSGGTLSGTAAVSFFDSNSASSRRWSISNGAGGNTTDLIGKLVISYGGTSTADPMTGTAAAVFDSSGRVGIGTTTVNTTLEVLNSSTPIIRVGDGTRHVQLWGGSSTQNQAVGTATSAAFNININSSPVATFDTSGRLLVGTSSSPSAGLGQYALAVVQGYAGSTTGEGILSIARGKAATALVNTDTVGQIAFTDNAGNTFAKIVSFVDGTVSSTSDLPGALSFSTTADGASSPTERMRITNDGRVLLGATTGDSGLVVDRAVSRAALGTTAPARIYTGAGTITDNTTVASGTVAHGTIVSFDNPAIAATNASVTYTRASTLYVDGAPTAGTNVTISNRYGLFVNAGNTVLGENVTIGGAVIPASATASLSLINGTIPSASVVNGVSLYAEDVSASSELKVRDEAGNITTLSPHNFSLIPEGPSEEMAWAFYSERDGTKINVDMLKAIRLLEQLTGEQLVYLSEAQ